MLGPKFLRSSNRSCPDSTEGTPWEPTALKTAKPGLWPLHARTASFIYQKVAC